MTSCTSSLKFFTLSKTDFLIKSVKPCKYFSSIVEFFKIATLNLMVNISNSYYAGALVTETLHMRMYRSKFLRHFAFRSVWLHKLVETFSSKIKKVKRRKSKLKYLRDLSLQGQETSKTSLLATYFLSNFHLPGKKCSYILLNISDLFDPTQFQKRNTKSYRLNHSLFHFIFNFYFFMFLSHNRYIINISVNNSWCFVPEIGLCGKSNDEL